VRVDSTGFFQIDSIVHWPATLVGCASLSCWSAVTVQGPTDGIVLLLRQDTRAFGNFERGSFGWGRQLGERGFASGR